MRILLILFLLISPILLPAQKQINATIDSILKVLPGAKNDTNEVKLLNILSFDYSYSNNELGIKYGQQALELATKLDWKPGIGRAENCLGVNYSDMSDFPSAREYFLKAIEVYDAISDHEMKAGVFNNLGAVYCDQSNYSNALECLFKAKKIYEDIGNEVNIKNSLSIIGNVYFAQSDYSMALEYYLKSLKICEDIGDKEGITNNLNGIGNVYTSQKDYSKALDYYSRDLKILEETGNKRGIADVNTNIGCIYAAQRKDSIALGYFFKALKIDQEIGQRNDAAIVSMNIGNSYNGLKNYDMALVYEQDCLKNATEIGNKYLVAMDLSAMGDLYLSIARLPAPIQNEKRKYTVAHGIDSPFIMPKSKLALVNNASVAFHRGILIARDINAPDVMQACYEHLADANKLTGNYKLALEYSDSGRAVKDSVFSTGNKIKITNLETKREFALKDKQLEIDRLEIIKKRNERIFYISGILLVIAIGVLFINRQRLKQQRTEAENKNMENELRIAEMDKNRAAYLLRERVKELSTIYLLNRILEDENLSIEGTFHEIVKILPPGWQYPEICAAKIVFDNNEYITPNYLQSEFIQQATLKTQDGRTGIVEVIYLKEAPEEDEGPFLKEERDLINTLAKTIEVHFNKKLNQEALATSEARFRSAFEHASIGMALVSLAGKWLKVNKALCEIVGYSEKELLSIGFQQITHPDDLEKDLSYVQQTLDGTIDFYRIEKRYLNKNGSQIWINLNVSLVRDEKLQPLYFVSQVENINDKIESEQKFRGLVESSAVGVYILQNDKFIYVNPRMCEESGYTMDELTSLPLDKLVHRDDIMTVYRNIKARLKGEVDEVRYGVRAVRKNGGIIWVEMFGTVMEFHGAPAIIGTMVNITEQKKSQELINKSQAELSAFFDNVEGSACLVDANKRYIIFNRSFIQEHKRLTGKDPIPGMEIYEFFPPDVKAARHALLDEVLNGNKQAIEVDYIRDGKHVFYRTTFNPVMSNGNAIGISTYSIDLSEIKNAQHEILRLNRLYQFISQINESMLKLENREQIYAESCRIAVEVGKFHMAWIGSYDKKEDKTTPAAWAGVEDGFFDAIDIEGMKVSQSAIPSARAIRAKTHFYYNDIATDPEIPQNVKAEMLKRRYLSGLSFPIFVNSEIVAALVLLMAEPFFFNDEEIHLLREVTDNITYALDKIRIRDLHNKSEANLKSIFDTTHVSYLLLDEHFSVLAYNQHLMSWYEDMTGVSLATGANFYDLASPGLRDDITNVWESVLASGTPVEYETSFSNKEVTLYFTIAVRPVISNEKTIGLCITAHDITNRKHIEIERQKMINKLTQRNRDLEQFSYIVSHNLRAPVANIIGLAKVLEDDYLDTELQREMMGSLSLSVNRLDSVIMDLNYILQVRQDIHEREEIIRFPDILSDILISLNAASIGNVTIKSDFSEADSFFTIKSYIYSIFFNLISNSIKFRQPGNQTLIEIFSIKNENKITLIFRDNGLGIDLEKRGEYVFGLYKRFHLSMDGKGMGLYMVKTQVELLGGTIEIVSEVNKRTEFRLHFDIV